MKRKLSRMSSDWANYVNPRRAEDGLRRRQTPISLPRRQLTDDALIAEIAPATMEKFGLDAKMRNSDEASRLNLSRNPDDNRRSAVTLRSLRPSHAARFVSRIGESQYRVGLRHQLLP